MSEFQSFGMSSGQNTQNLLIGSGLVVSIASGVYSYQQISELRAEVELLKTHLAAVVPNVNPEINKRIDHCIHAINILNRRLGSQIEAPAPASEVKTKTLPSPVRKYQRMTKKLGDPGDPDDPEIEHEDLELNAAVLALEQHK